MDPIRKKSKQAKSRRALRNGLSAEERAYAIKCLMQISDMSREALESYTDEELSQMMADHIA